LGNPEYSVCQADVVHVDYTRNSSDSSDPKDGGSGQLNCAGDETNFTPSTTPPNPLLLDLAIFVPHVFPAMEPVRTFGVETVDGIAEADLPLMGSKNKVKGATYHLLAIQRFKDHENPTQFEDSPSHEASPAQDGIVNSRNID
jgi:hypothetical protein